MEITVAARPYPAERRNCVWYCARASPYTEKLNVWTNPSTTLPSWVETEAMKTIGTTRKIASQSPPGRMSR
ncbi:hypothetical protein GCM10018952_26470 [Streptosporangium vulgare]